MSDPIGLAVIDELLQNIDGQTIDVGPDSWWLRVYSLHRVDEVLCVQVAALGSRHLILTIALPALGGKESAIALIFRFLQEPDGDHPGIVDATPLSPWAAVVSCSDVVH